VSPAPPNRLSQTIGVLCSSTHAHTHTQPQAHASNAIMVMLHSARWCLAVFQATRTYTSYSDTGVVLLRDTNEQTHIEI
jgi:hypothetical protein